MTRIYYWIHHTGDYVGNTGVQRVVRNLAAALTDAGLDVVLVRWCAEREAIVRADRQCGEGLSSFGGPSLQVGPEEGEPLHLATADQGKLNGAWLLLPEVPHVAGPESPNLAVVFDYARFYGLRSAAIFYDLVPLRRPGYESWPRIMSTTFVRSSLLTFYSLSLTTLAIPCGPGGKGQVMTLHVCTTPP